MAYRLGSVQVSRLQVALLVGTPVVIGFGIYAYCKAKSSNQIASDKKPKELENMSFKDSYDIKELDTNQKITELPNDPLSPLREATMFKAEGNECYKKGEYDLAIQFYDKAVDKCPPENKTDLAIFYQNRAAAYEMLKKWTAVKEDCTRSLEANPRYSKAYFRRAKAYEALGDYTECFNDVTAACILEMFQNNATIMYADRILKLTGRADAEKASKNKKPALPSDNFIETYLRSFVADPLQKMKLPMTVFSEPARGFVRAKLALDEKRYAEIIPACTEEIELSEAEGQYKSEALLLRGIFHLLSGSFGEAQCDFDKVISSSTTDSKLRSYAFLKRALLHLQKENKEMGLEDFERALQLQPDNPDIYHQRAQVFIMLGQLEKALEEFEKVTKIAPNNAMAYVQKCYAEYRLSLTTQNQMRLLMVMNEFKNAVEKFPDCVDCYSLMAQVLSEQNQFQQADQLYERALKIAPDNASLHVHRGIMMIQWRGDVESAVSLINHAIQVDDKCELAYETLGTIEVQRANLDRAVELFNKAIELAKGTTEMCHLFSLRNAAIAQINVTQKLGIDLSTIAAMAQSGEMPNIAIEADSVSFASTSST